MADFDELMRLHEQMVLRTAWHLLGSIADAEDAAQEVFLRLHRNLRRVEGDARPWLYRVTVNVCRDLYRARLAAVSLEDAPEPWVEAAAEDVLARDLVRQGLHRLSESERVAVVLREIEGRDTAEVAQVLGCSEATVRSHVSNGRAKLKAYVERMRDAGQRTRQTLR